MCPNTNLGVSLFIVSRDFYHPLHLKDWKDPKRMKAVCVFKDNGTRENVQGK